MCLQGGSIHIGHDLICAAVNPHSSFQRIHFTSNRVDRNISAMNRNIGILSCGLDNHPGADICTLETGENNGFNGFHIYYGCGITVHVRVFSLK